MRILSLLALPLIAAAPIDDGPPHSPEHHPAFDGQTRAPEVHTRTSLAVTTVARGLDHPWGLAFLPDGRMLVTERDKGSIRIIGAGGRLSPPLTGVPRTDIGGQGGMLDVALAPDFARSHRSISPTVSRAAAETAPRSRTAPSSTARSPGSTACV